MKRLLTFAAILATLIVAVPSVLEAVTVSPAAIPFESAHPYESDLDDTWVYDHGTPGFAFHFSQLELTGDGDAIEILDATDTILKTITETSSGGYLSVRVPTSVGKVRFTSNSSGVVGGFVVDGAYSIGASVLGASSSANPTSIQFGPDGRLYVAQMDGQIHAYTVARNGPNDYTVTATEIISEIYDLPNHDDDGTLNAGVVGRLLTGLWVEGTATNPVIFAVSSDPRTTRVGGSPNGDTNSGVLSRLTWNGAAWAHLPLVRGLPRSAVNHASNGLVRDAASNTIYLAQGGHTNEGGASAFSELLPEYALSGAVLSIDLAAIGETTFDLATLDDPARAGDPDAGDPFGGNDGANQSVIDPAGPVQVYAPGFRNPYDLALTAAGRLYVTDNGPGDGLGGPPTDEGAGGICTSAEASAGLHAPDGLHYISAPGYYGGHPNPVRGNPAASPFGAAVPLANAIECDYQISGTDDPSIATFPASTNGIDEYTSTNLNGIFTGNLFTISWDGTLSRILLNPAGDSATLVQPFLPGISGLPLDVAIPGSGDPFEGTIWVADWLSGDINVYEATAPIPQDTTPPTYVSHSFDPPSGAATTSVDVSVTASDSDSGVASIDVWMNDAPDGSQTGSWHQETIVGPSGIATFDLSSFGVGTFAVAIDIYDVEGNTTLWSEAHANPSQLSSYTVVPDTILAPGEDFQAAVDAHPAGTQFLILSGTHRFQSVEPKDGMSFVGQPGAVMTGARVLSGWTSDGSLWWVGGQTQQGFIHGSCEAAYPRCERPEDLFINGVPMHHVATQAEAGPGSWFFDYDADRIYIGDDPTAVLVDTSVTRNAFFGTAEAAMEAGADWVLRNPVNMGLGFTFQRALLAAVERGADVVVNTDADNHYDQSAIPELVEPIRSGEADIVIGSRIISRDDMPAVRYYGNRLANRIMQSAVGLPSIDVSTGFRAYSREAAIRTFVSARYTYTHETLLSALDQRLVIANRPIPVRKVTRPSRLMHSVPSHIFRAGLVIAKAFLIYRPMTTYPVLALLVALPGFIVLTRFLIQFAGGDGAGHTQSLVIGMALIIVAAQILILGLVAYAIRENRWLLQEILRNSKDALLTRRPDRQE